ncbi:hypothetical protein TMatcc_001720 [Talaromyces marneffei ATCC 18224]|uniref:uncharacterized protein n=1 Tax=Talaromyces marneffei TaxID=37727 RepID=UPI0012A7BBDF|nr:uncharacterized protein EYB26_007076 [Talaromyces marneffei]KAE8551740.1 hypothetical protein EYB25_005630 [Talaromyces marneffei]QGA19387.1 hypothetical protein EYB26_007076 [Talaromyces marneffei]
MLPRLLNIKPSPRLFASIAPSSQSVAANTSTPKQSSTASKKPSRLRKPALSLDQFIQRQRVLSFWREIIRAVYKIPPSPTRTELRDYARNEFKRNKSVEDVAHIRYLLSAGKTEFDTMRRYIDELASMNR